MPKPKPKDTHFSIDCWGQKHFPPDYHMTFGPFPLSQWNSEVITTNLKKFQPEAKFLKYKHQNVDFKDKKSR